MADTRNPFELLIAYADDETLATFIQNVEPFFIHRINKAFCYLEYCLAAKNRKPAIMLLHKRYLDLVREGTLTEKTVQAYKNSGALGAISYGHNELSSYYNEMNIPINSTVSFSVSDKEFNRAVTVNEDQATEALQLAIASGKKNRVKQVVEIINRQETWLISSTSWWAWPVFAIKCGQREMISVFIDQVVNGLKDDIQFMSTKYKNREEYINDVLSAIVAHGYAVKDDVRYLVSAISDPSMKRLFMRTFSVLATQHALPDVLNGLSGMLIDDTDHAVLVDNLLKAYSANPISALVRSEVLKLVISCINKNRNLLYLMVLKLSLLNKSIKNADEIYVDLIRLLLRGVDQDLKNKLLADKNKQKAEGQLVNDAALILIKMPRMLLPLFNPDGGVVANIMKALHDKVTPLEYFTLMFRLTGKRIENPIARYYAWNAAFFNGTYQFANYQRGKAKPEEETGYLAGFISICFSILKIELAEPYQDYCKNNLFKLVNAASYQPSHILTAAYYFKRVEASSAQLGTLYLKLKSDLICFRTAELKAKDINDKKYIMIYYGEIIASVMKLLNAVNVQYNADAKHVKDIKGLLLEYFDLIRRHMEVNGSDRIYARLVNLAEQSSYIEANDKADMVEPDQEEFLTSSAPEPDMEKSVPVLSNKDLKDIAALEAKKNKKQNNVEAHEAVEIEKQNEAERLKQESDELQKSMLEKQERNHRERQQHKEQLQQKRLEKKREEQERLEQERLELQRLEQARLEQERLERELLEQSKQDLISQRIVLGDEWSTLNTKTLELDERKAWLLQELARSESQENDLRNEWSNLESKCALLKSKAEELAVQIKSKEVPVHVRLHIENNTVLDIPAANPIYREAAKYGFTIACAVIFDALANNNVRLVDKSARYYIEGSQYHQGVMTFQMVGCLADFTKALPAIKYEIKTPSVPTIKIKESSRVPTITFKLDDDEMQLKFLHRKHNMSEEKILQKQSYKNTYTCSTEAVAVVASGLRFFGNRNSENHIKEKFLQFIDPQHADKYYIEHPVAILDAIHLRVEGYKYSPEIIAQCKYIKSNQDDFTNVCKKHLLTLQQRLTELLKEPKGSSQSVGLHLYLVYTQFKFAGLIKPFLESGVLSNEKLYSIRAAIHDYRKNNVIADEDESSKLNGAYQSVIASPVRPWRKQ